MPTLIENLRALIELIELTRQDVITGNTFAAEIKLETTNNCIQAIINQLESIK